MNKLDQLYYKNVIRRTKLMIAKRNLDKKIELAKPTKLH